MLITGDAPGSDLQVAGPVTAMALSPDDRLPAVGYGDGSGRLRRLDARAS
ncbi:MAG TPA: hypothetical protein VHU92_11330 [Streptosporangiaceae bacterium]|nr:hypothetical protein [Streptosporangiaceae bacterium]